jgi:hypothetical protein
MGSFFLSLNKISQCQSLPVDSFLYHSNMLLVFEHEPKQLLVASAIPVGYLSICQIFRSIIVDQWTSRICKHSRVGTRLSEYL